MLGRWDESKGLAQQYQAPLKDLVLTRAAYEMHRRHETKMSIDQFKAFVSTELAKRGHSAEVESLLKEILVRSGLLRIVDQDVEFRHLLLQEFFAGRGIPNRDTLDILIPDEWWKRAIVFYFGERPGDAEGLRQIMGSMWTKPGNEIYVVSTTLGLAMQACYFVEVNDKVEVLRAVIDGLAKSKEVVLQSDEQVKRMPTLGFIFYYLYGRDSVASSVLRDRIEEIMDKWKKGGLSKDEVDTRMFWLLVGLIESGACDKCEELLKKFRPIDERFLLGIHLGCYLTQHLRMATREEKEMAQRISRMVADQVEGLRQQVLEEFKSELLEIQRGHVSALETPKEQTQHRSVSGDRLGT